MITPSQRPLPDNTQHSQETDIHVSPAGFEPAIPAGERPQTDAFDRAATGTDRYHFMRRKSHKYCRGTEHGAVAGLMTSHVDTVSVGIVSFGPLVNDFLLHVCSSLVGKRASFLLAKCWYLAIMLFVVKGCMALLGPYLARFGTEFDVCSQ